MITAECTPRTHSSRTERCGIRLVEFTYGVADDGVSMLPSSVLSISDWDEIDWALTLDDENVQCAYCEEQATYLRDGVPVCTPPVGRGRADYNLTHGVRHPALAAR
jgi:hypothetical protein